MDKKLLLKLFITNLYLSAFTFGGGYVIITLMKKKYVDELDWIKEKEMLDLIAIAQSAPGEDQTQSFFVQRAPLYTGPPCQSLFFFISLIIL